MNVVLFAGCGGADRGIEAAGLPVHVAINHSPTAISVHRRNFPHARHFTTDVWDVEPLEATGGEPVDLLWASPDCTHFSVAKGGKPKDQGIRSLAWVVVAWAKRTKPRRIFMENVKEFQGWGPLGADGRPIPERKGETFRKFVGELERFGYRVEWRVLNASHYGAPTARNRWYLIAARDAEPIYWPEPTHGPGRLPVRTAAECIDWSIPCPSIFDRKRPLAVKTQRRIAEGILRFVLQNPTPFIIGCDGRAGQTPPTPLTAPVGTITAKNDRSLVVPTLVQTGYGERPGQAPRALDLHAPLGTVVAQGAKHALVSSTLVKLRGECNGSDVAAPMPTITAGGLHVGAVAAYLTKHFGGVVGVPFDGRPLDTVTAQDHHALTTATLGTTDLGVQVDRSAQVSAFLTSYYGDDATGGQCADRPMRTITAKARMGLVTVTGVEYRIVDIGMRMLRSHELHRAQFGEYADGFDLSDATSEAAKIRLIGNSVCPAVAEALVRANTRGAVPMREAA